MSQIGRNDPCYCGSGKKYKKCCLSFPGTLEVERNLVLKERLQSGYPEFFSKDQTFFNTEDLSLKKMSEIIFDLADFFLHICDTHYAQERLIHFTIAAWNISLLDKSKHEETINIFIKEMGIDQRPELEEDCAIARHLFHMIISKKLSEYPDDKRFIADYVISKTPDGPYLNVAAIVPHEQLHLNH